MNEKILKIKCKKYGYNGYRDLTAKCDVVSKVFCSHR